MNTKLSTSYLPQYHHFEEDTSARHDASTTRRVQGSDVWVLRTSNFTSPNFWCESLFLLHKLHSRQPTAFIQQRYCPGCSL